MQSSPHIFISQSYGCISTPQHQKAPRYVSRWQQNTGNHSNRVMHLHVFYSYSLYVVDDDHSLDVFSSGMWHWECLVHFQLGMFLCVFALIQYFNTLFDTSAFKSVRLQIDNYV